MMKYLRFQGAAVFILIVSLIALCFYLFAEFFIKKGIETSVEWYTGAEVNVAEVELDYLPLTLAVLGFQATDAENPQQNIVAFKQAKVSLEFWQYLFGKVIIDDLIIDGLSFSSPRTKVGEVYQKTAELNQTAETEQSTSLSDEVKKNLPDPKKLLEDSDLLTVKASNALTEAYKVETVKLKAIKEQLPTKEKLAKYQEDVKALAKIKVKSLEDLEQIKSQYDELKKQFKADKAIVKEAKQTLANTQTVLTERVTALKNAPGEDWRQIEKTYQLDKIDSADFAHILFGEQAREYYETAQMVYEKLSPLISSEPTEQEVKKEAAEGRFVFFQEDDPLPELLIKNALFSVIMPQGDFAITIEEFTHQHWLRNKPTLYSVVSDNIGQSGDVKLTGTFILSEQKQFNANGQWQLSDMKLSQAKLRDTKNLSLMLKEGFLFGHGAVLERE